MIIGCVNPKGGACKSTLVLTVADGLSREGNKVLVIDADFEQQTALKWSDKGTPGFQVHAVSAGGLEGTLNHSKAHYDHILVDTGSSTDPATKVIQGMLLRLSDLILIPIQPSPADFDELGKPIAMIKERWALAGDNNPNAAFVLCKVKLGTKLYAEAKALLSTTGIHQFETVLRESEAYKQQYGKGETVFDHHEYEQDGSNLISELKEFVTDDVVS